MFFFFFGFLAVHLLQDKRDETCIEIRDVTMSLTLWQLGD